MKPSDINQILDLAKLCRQQGRTFNPLFTGDAGIGKSEICQAWVKKQQETNPKFGFIDLRLAVMEAQDLVGHPRVITVGKETKTSFALPDFWPNEGEGLLLLEEPNRADSSCMNAIMQLLTDRKVHNYKLPEGWIIAGNINPETNYDVNTMDTALKDRFEIFEINYDLKTFTDFMVKNNWSTTLVSFVQSGLWQFKTPDELGKDDIYISPRTFSKLNNAEMVGVKDNSALFYETAISKLGKKVGREYFTYVEQERPILIEDVVRNLDDSIKRLKKLFSKDEYRADIADALLKSIENDLFKHAEFKEEHLVKVAETLPAELAIQLLAKVYEVVERQGREDDEKAGGENKAERRLDFDNNIYKKHGSLFEKLKKARLKAVKQTSEINEEKVNKNAK